MNRKDLWKQPAIQFLLVVSFVAIIGFTGVHLMNSRKPVEVSYASGCLIFSPGLFYTLDEYQDESIYIYDTVLQPPSESRQAYAFPLIHRSGLQYLTIYYHDWGGEEGHTKFQIQFDDGNGLIFVAEESFGGTSFLFLA